MRLFGLVGYPLSHSFSKFFFTEKFKKENLDDCRYENFELTNIKLFKELKVKNPTLCGLNVTIPYKSSIIPFLSQLHPVAAETGAVNTILFSNDATKGFNTDVTGFYQTIKDNISSSHHRALVLGTGGSAKAIAYVLRQLKIPYTQVSRNDKVSAMLYSQLTKDIIDSHLLIINCTPAGRYPNINELPPLPYHYLSENHFLYDLNYNPAETLFLREGLKQGTQIKNGMEMLIKQAEASWQIWNNESHE